MSDGKLLYNGNCPVCAGGVDAYGKGGPPGTCRLVDVTREPEELARHGLTLKDVRYRVHFVTVDGRVLRGVPALAALAERDGRFTFLVRLVRLPGLSLLAAGLYELIAAPLNAWNLWREWRQFRARAASAGDRPA